MPETYEVPTAAEIAEHLEKGGEVERWCIEDQGWTRSFVWAVAGASYPDTPQPGYRLVPLPPRTVTVKLPEDDARAIVRQVFITPAGRRLRDAVSEALG